MLTTFKENKAVFKVISAGGTAQWYSACSAHTKPWEFNTQHQKINKIKLYIYIHIYMVTWKMHLHWFCIVIYHFKFIIILKRNYQRPGLLRVVRNRKGEGITITFFKGRHITTQVYFLNRPFSQKNCIAKAKCSVGEAHGKAYEPKEQNWLSRNKPLHLSQLIFYKGTMMMDG